MSVTKLMNDFTYNAAASMRSGDGITMAITDLSWAGAFALLFAFLVIGVQWQSSETVAVEARNLGSDDTRGSTASGQRLNCPIEDPKPIVEPPKEIEKPLLRKKILRLR